MTALSRLRRRLGPPDGSTPRAFFDLETVKALLELADACEAEEVAECRIRRPDEPYDPLELTCDDVGHVDGCPIVSARQRSLTALDKLRGLP